MPHNGETQCSLYRTVRLVWLVAQVSGCFRGFVVVAVLVVVVVVLVVMVVFGG